MKFRKNYVKNFCTVLTVEYSTKDSAVQGDKLHFR